MRIPLPRTSRHPLSLAVAVALLAVSLAGCSAGATQALPSITPGTTAQWTVVVSDPVFHSEETCDSDPDIEVAALSTDMPSSGLGITLIAGADEGDAQRVADCLKRNLESGEISILSPK